MTAVHPDFVRASEMLPVPRPDRIRPEQADGSACVWCGQPPAVDLGSRLSTHTGALHRWNPRACQACAAEQAGRVLGIHTGQCARCRQRDRCPDARALRDLATSSQLPAPVRRRSRR